MAVNGREHSTIEIPIMDKQIRKLRKLKNKPGALGVGRDAPLWRTRRSIRKARRFGRVLARGKTPDSDMHLKLHVYKNVEEFAGVFFPDFKQPIAKQEALGRVKQMIAQLGYTVVERNETKPWGGFYRLSDDDAGQFIHDFFPGLTLHEARLGRADVRLSPKFLLIAPGTRLSWQYHNRRAERWHFLTAGTYTSSDSDDQPEPTRAPAGTIVQLATSFRHRVTAPNDTDYVLVAEVWQHTDLSQLSDEDDIIRLQDDYSRTLHR